MAKIDTKARNTALIISNIRLYIIFTLIILSLLDILGVFSISLSLSSIIKLYIS